MAEFTSDGDAMLRDSETSTPRVAPSAGQEAAIAAGADATVSAAIDEDDVHENATAEEDAANPI